MSKLKSLSEAYKFDKWDLYFGNKKINKCKDTFVLFIVKYSLTFQSWLEEEDEKSTYTIEFFKCVWR